MNWILDFLLNPIVPDVTYSIAWWIPMAASAAINIGGKLLSNKKKNKSNMSPQRRNVQQSRSDFSDYLNNIIEKQESVSNQPRLTAEDLFGGQMQRQRDSAGASANATKRMLSRAIMGQGGDISGSGASNLLGVDQQLNEQLGQQGLGFERLALSENRFQDRRGDQMRQAGLQGLQNLFGMDQQILQDKVLQNQAANQRRGNLFGNILNAGTTLSTELLRNQ